MSAAITQASGTLFITSDLWSGHVNGTTPSQNVFRIPRGCDLKIWEASIYGYPAKVAVMASNDVGSNYQVVKSYANLTNVAASNAVITVKHTGRPVVIPSPDGKKVVRFNYETQDAGSLNNVYADFTVEIVQSETY
jgi:hypothetical protein